MHGSVLTRLHCFPLVTLGSERLYTINRKGESEIHWLLRPPGRPHVIRHNAWLAMFASPRQGATPSGAESQNPNILLARALVVRVRLFNAVHYS
jgi:hypothetical protein